MIETYAIYYYAPTFFVDMEGRHPTHSFQNDDAASEIILGFQSSSNEGKTSDDSVIQVTDGSSIERAPHSTDDLKTAISSNSESTVKRDIKKYRGKQLKLNDVSRN